MARHGMTIPFDGVSLADHRPLFEELVELGYDDVWSSEANGSDAFIPMALASAWTPSLRVGCAIINWLSADDVAKVVPEVQAGHQAAGKQGSPEIVARIFVCPSEDANTVRNFGRMAIAAYLNVPVYAAFHEWLGRGPQLKAMWDNWRAGDRKAATASIPDEVVDDLIIHGSPAECRAQVQRYIDNRVTTTPLAIMPFGTDGRQAARDLAPNA